MKQLPPSWSVSSAYLNSSIDGQAEKGFKFRRNDCVPTYFRHHGSSCFMWAIHSREIKTMDVSSQLQNKIEWRHRDTSKFTNLTSGKVLGLFLFLIFQTCSLKFNTFMNVSCIFFCDGDIFILLLTSSNKKWILFLILFGKPFLLRKLLCQLCGVRRKDVTSELAWELCFY